MSEDRGAFGSLLEELRGLGEGHVFFGCALRESCTSEERWWVTASHETARGRTGEEALRRLVERVRVARKPIGT